MMPELPKKNKKKESEFGEIFRVWYNARKDIFVSSCSFELKDTDGAECLNFNEVSERQIASGLRNATGNLIRAMVATPGTPDYLLLKGAPAYIVIRYPKFFCLIRVERFIEEKRASARKSLTSVRAADISEVLIPL